MIKAGYTLVSSAFLVAFAIVSTQSAFAGEKKNDTAALLGELKNGGYVIYMRHPHTDKSQKDTDKKNLANCTTQRNLSDKGRDVARNIGTAIKSLKVSFKTVKTSEYCRARQVPELMGLEKAEQTTELNHSGSLAKDDAKKRADALKGMFASSPEKATNTLLIGHSPNIRDVNIDLISEGFKPADMLVLKPKADKSGYEFVGRVTPANWKSWAEKNK